MALVPLALPPPLKIRASWAANGVLQWISSAMWTLRQHSEILGDYPVRLSDAGGPRPSHIRGVERWIEMGAALALSDAWEDFTCFSC